MSSWREQHVLRMPATTIGIQTKFPGFTLEQMDEVYYCEYKWYDATEAPYCY